MSGSLSNYAASALQNLTLRGDAYSSPATVYLGWFLTPPAADGTATELTGGGYVRKAITFSTAAAGSVTQDAAVTWTALNAASDTMLAGFGIFDAATAGNLLACGPMPSTLITIDGAVTVPVGSITIASGDEHMSDYLANAWLNHLFNATAYTAPSNVYFAHYTATPTATAAGTEVTGYSRQLADWNIASLGASLLTADVTWAPLATTAFTLDGWALTDAATTGNVLWFYQWPTPVAVPAGDTVTLAAATITLRAH